MPFLADLIHEYVEDTVITAFQVIMSPKSEDKAPEPAEPAEYAWTPWAKLMAAALLICPLLCLISCVAIAFKQDCQDCQDCLTSYEIIGMKDGRHSMQSLRRHMYSMAIFLLLALLGAPWTSCEGSPMWLYWLYVPLLVAIKVAEYRLMCAQPAKAWGCAVWFNFLISGPLCHLDVFTHLLVLSQLSACDPMASASFAAHVLWLAPLVQCFGLFGLAGSLLALSLISQQLLAVIFTIESKSLLRIPSLAADAQNMLGLAELLDHETTRHGRVVLLSISKVFMETVPQLYLQTSFLSLAFDHLSPSGRGQILLSVLLATCGAFHQVGRAMLVMFRGIVQDVKRSDCDAAAMNSVILLLNLAALSSMTWTLVKLYYMFHCESHLWDFSGCLPA